MIWVKCLFCVVQLNLLKLNLFIMAIPHSSIICIKILSIEKLKYIWKIMFYKIIAYDESQWMWCNAKKESSFVMVHMSSNMSSLNDYTQRSSNAIAIYN